jgi:hypothetical protein
MKPIVLEKFQYVDGNDTISLAKVQRSDGSVVWRRRCARFLPEEYQGSEFYSLANFIGFSLYNTMKIDTVYL